MMHNEAFGWSWITLGFVTGALLGLRFHQTDWLGGYNSLRRRMLRLGHIAIVALGLVNVLVAYSLPRANIADWQQHTASWAWIVGAITMPLVCGLTAWRPGFRHWFFVPVASLLTGAITMMIGMWRA
jgi:hypothetical protein